VGQTGPFSTQVSVQNPDANLGHRALTTPSLLSRGTGHDRPGIIWATILHLVLAKIT